MTGSQRREPPPESGRFREPAGLGNRLVRFRRSDPVPESGNRPGTAGDTGGSPVPPPPRAEPGTAPAPCTPGTNGQVLPDRHQDDCPRHSCPGCLPCPEPHCLTCRRNHAETTCPTCLTLARSNLTRLAELVANLEAEAVNGRQAFHTHDAIPGGDALVLLISAATLRGRTGTPIHLLTQYELPHDPRPPLDVLTFWEEMWRRETNAPTHLPPTMARATTYLDSQLHLIARHRMFPHLHRDLKRAVHQTENVLHAGHRPDVSRVPCLECGTRIIKVWSTTEDHDHWRCPTCGETYNQGRYERALHDHLASRGADRYVPISDACAATGRPERTVRDWLRREVVDHTRDPVTGRLLVWWPDVREAHTNTQTRRTGGARG